MSAPHERDAGSKHCEQLKRVHDDYEREVVAITRSYTADMLGARITHAVEVSALKDKLEAYINDVTMKMYTDIHEVKGNLNKALASLGKDVPKAAKPDDHSPGTSASAGARIKEIACYECKCHLAPDAIIRCARCEKWICQVCAAKPPHSLYDH